MITFVLNFDKLLYFKNMKKYQYIYLILLLTIVFSSCKKKNRDQIPLVYVSINVYLSNPQYINLTTVSGWEYVLGGSRGILVYRKSQDEFKAFDRHCPYSPEDDCARVEVDSTNITAIDPCCGSKFSSYKGHLPVWHLAGFEQHFIKEIPLCDSTHLQGCYWQPLWEEE